MLRPSTPLQRLRPVACACAAAALLVAACGVQPRPVVVTPTPHSTLDLRAPAFITSGDSLVVMARDSDWSYEYTAAVDPKELAEESRAPVFGSAEGFDVIQAAFPMGREVAAATTSVSERRVELAAGEPARPVSDDSLTALVRERNTAALTAAYRALAGYRNSMADVVDAQAREVNAGLDSVNEALAGAPENVRALHFLVDTAAHRELRQFSSDTTARRLRRILTEAMQAGDRTIADTTADREFRRVGDYARRLRSVSALVPTVPSAGTASSSALGRALSGLAKTVPAYDSAEARFAHADQVVAQVAATLRRLRVRPPAVERDTPTVRAEPLRAAGIELRPLLAEVKPGGELAELRTALFTIDENSRTVADVSAQIPAWVHTDSLRQVYGRVFHGNQTLNLTITRFRRPPPFVYKQAPVPTGGEHGTDGNAKEAAAGALENSADSQTVTRGVLLLERYRFHIGAGFVYSPLDAHTFTSSADTVGGVAGQRATETTVARNSFFPALFVGYTLLPLRGRLLDGNAERNGLNLQRAGLSLQTAMSLQHPTEQLYFGLSTEPLPGLSFGAGYHLGYLPRARAGEFVAEDRGPAVRHRWIGTWGAASMVVDAEVFAGTVGKLLK